MAIDWDALFELAPDDTTYVKDTDDAIRSLKTATRERLTKEHEFDLASQARQGLHRAGSAVAFYQASAPTQRNGVDLAAADAGLLWVDSDDKLTKVWDGDSFESLHAVAQGGAADTATKVASTTPGARGLMYLAAASTAVIAPLVLADIKTVDGAGSGLDADTVDGYGVTTANTNGIRVRHGSSVGLRSENDVFDDLSPAIPNINDRIQVSGGVIASGVLYAVSSAYRASSSTIYLYMISADGTAQKVLENGEAAQVQHSITW